MKQGKCDACNCRWVSDRDMGKVRDARCPLCRMPLRATTAYSALPVRIDPKASAEFRERIRKDHAEGLRIYIDY